jgi:hypothetical protein
LAKKIRAVLKLQLDAGKATPAPPVGSALGQDKLVPFVGFFGRPESRILSHDPGFFAVHFRINPAGVRIFSRLSEIP